LKSNDWQDSDNKKRARSARLNIIFGPRTSTMGNLAELFFLNGLQSKAWLASGWQYAIPEPGRDF